MNLRIINDCARTEPGLQTAEANPGRRMFCFVPKQSNIILIQFTRFLSKFLLNINLSPIFRFSSRKYPLMYFYVREMKCFYISANNLILVSMLRQPEKQRRAKQPYIYIYKKNIYMVKYVYMLCDILIRYRKYPRLRYL